MRPCLERVKRGRIVGSRPSETLVGRHLWQLRVGICSVNRLGRLCVDPLGRSAVSDDVYEVGVLAFLLLFPGFIFRSCLFFNALNAENLEMSWLLFRARFCSAKAGYA